MIHGRRNSGGVPCRLQNFTLIELLIVVAIITILAGMLLPALNKARDRAKTIKCLGNVKQFSTANQMYAQDNNDYPVLLYNRVDPENSNILDFEKGCRVSGGFGSESPYEGYLPDIMAPAGGVRFLDGKWHKSNLVCPSRVIPDTSSDSVGSSYGVNGNHGTVTSFPIMKITQVRRPSRCVQLAEIVLSMESGPKGYYDSATVDGRRRVIAPHGTSNSNGELKVVVNGASGNIAFLDGHSTGISQDRIPYGASTAIKSTYFWKWCGTSDW